VLRLGIPHNFPCRTSTKGE